MTALLEEQKPFLDTLLAAKHEQRKALLRTISFSQLKALSEIAHNVVKGTIALSPEEKKKLRRYRKVIFVLGKKRVTRKNKLKNLERGANAVLQLLSITGTQPWTK